MKWLSRVGCRLVVAVYSITSLCAAPALDTIHIADDYFKPLIGQGKIAAAAYVFLETGKSPTVRLYGPVDARRSQWRLASVSKVFTAIAIMRLFEDGTIRLDDNVNLYLKHIRLPDTFSQPITIRELLLHRAGLDDWFVGDGFRSGRQPSMLEVMAAHLPARVYPPGVVEFYSNYGYGLLGAVIEDVTGQRFEEYMQRSVLIPLGMRDSTFEQPIPNPSRMAPGNWFY
jgi:CubicO group peptidase (beta-lactamase class C family)